VVRPAGAPGLDLVNPGPQTNSEGDKVRLKLEWASTALGTHRDTRPTFTAAGLPPGLHIREHDGTIAGQVSRRGEGTYNVIVTLRVNNEEVTETFQWTILPRNHAPQLKEIDDQDSTVGHPFRLYVRAVDADEDDLTFDVQGLPPGVTFNAATGAIEGVPSQSRDEFTVTVIVSDGRASDRQSFGWRVRRAKR
jgi:Putative Ig domain